jgi:hypothetical protein
MMERYKLPIPWDAKPVSHIPPLRRIDPANPGGYPKMISREEVEHGGREPDPRLYRFSILLNAWVLKEEFC